MDNAVMGFSLSPGSKTIGSMTVAGVLVVGLTDWLQGSTPDGVIEVGDGAGLALFVLCSIGVALVALVATERSADEPVVVDWVIVMALATLASLLADPTYAVLLFAVPLVHIARGWPEPIRSRTIVALFVLAAALVSLENQPWGGNNLESAMMLFIALLITTMLGSALGRLDEARTTESASARLDERERLAGELHDSVGHSLLASSIQLRNARALWDADVAGAQRSVELASRAVEEALVDTRIAVDTIRSRSEPFSLAAALPELIHRMASPALTVELTLDGLVDSVDQLAQITLYRVAQEALTNVVRHADASVVTVHHAASGSEATLVITDDGKGYDVDAESAHLGLRGLEERLQRVEGRLEVTSRYGEGTALTATIGRTL